MHTLLQDLQYGARILLKKPGFTLIAVLTLALGIGANTAIFSVTNALLLRSLPVKEPNELLLVTTFDGEDTEHNCSYPLYEQLQAGSRNFAGFFAASDVSRRHLKIGGTQAQSIRTQEVTGNFFPVLGVPARLGRMFTTDDDQADHPQPVAVISHSFWQRRFNSDPAVIGKKILIEENIQLTIVGVTPPGFFGVQPGEHPDLWWPLQTMLQAVPERSRQELKNDGGMELRLMGRLPAGINRAQAQAEFDLIFQRHWAEFIKRNAAYWADLRQVMPDQKLKLQPGAGGYTGLRRQFRRPLLLLMATVGLVLLIACANIASLTLARAATRQREFMVRSALGAGRLRLIRQLLTESMLLSGLGGLLGAGLAQWGTQALLTLMRIKVDPISFNVAPDAHVLLFMLAASLLTGLLFGLAPAIDSSRLDLASALKGAAGSVAGNAVGQRFNQALVVAQVALSVVLLVGAGLLIRTLVKLNATDAGFDRENVVVFDLDFTHRVDEARRAVFYQELSARLETLPGVSAASMSSTFLLSGNTERHMIRVEGDTDHIIEGPNCNEIMISPAFFETTGTPLLGGRGIGRQDTITAGSSKAGTPLPAVINQIMARRFFGQAQPLGRRFYCKYEPELKFEVVGVAKDVRYQELREPAFPAYYIPFFQDQQHNLEMTFALRTTVDSAALIPGLRRIVQGVDQTIQLRDIRSLNEMVN
ncbi:MAG TPA: ABC transporter permease, partial [Blastocatellia bacterium]|nr:ABC transporter permease [Blastocatellia bacterium]